MSGDRPAEPVPPRSRGVIALDPEACTSCMVCARECPDWCIHITSHTETYAVEGSARPRQRQVLDRFAIDYALCLWCGICVEVCPFDALHWAPDHDYAAFDVRDLVHEKDRLAGWLPGRERAGAESALPSEAQGGAHPRPR